MARSRRKREERSGNGKGVSRRKPDVPLDTNAEVLPAKTVATEGQSDTQVPIRPISAVALLTCQGPRRNQEEQALGEEAQETREVYSMLPILV